MVTNGFRNDVSVLINHTPSSLRPRFEAEADVFDAALVRAKALAWI